MNLFNLMATISLDDKEYKKKVKEVTKQGKALEKVFTQIENGTGKVGKAINEISEASGNLAKGIMLTGTGIAAVITGLTLQGGFARAIAVEEAQAKLKGLGHSTENIKQIMDNALASVKGTAYGLGDAASLAAQLVAAGIEPGERLEKTLKTVADTAAISGREMGEVGLVFSKVAAKGKLQGGELLSLMESGIPVLQLLSTNTKVTEKAMAEFGDSSTESIQKLVSQGKISFEEFEESMRENVGGAALETGNTFRGAINNMKAALGRIGAELVTPFINWVTVISKDVIPAIDNFGGKVKETVPKIIDYFKNSDSVVPILYAIGGAITTVVLPGLIGMAAASAAAVVPLLPLIAAGASLAAIFYGIQNTSGVAKAALIALGVVVGTFTAIMVGLTTMSKLAALAQAKDTAAILIKTSAMVISTTATKAAFAAQKLLNLAMSANPIGLLIAGITALIAIFAVLFVKNETFRNAMIKTWEVVLSGGKAMWQWLGKLFGEYIPNFFKAGAKWFIGIPAWFGNLFVSIFNIVVEWFSNIFTYVLGIIPQIIESVGKWFAELPYKIGFALGVALATIYKWGTETWKEFETTCKNVEKTVVEWFSKLPGIILEFITNAYKNIVKWGVDSWKEFETACNNIHDSVKEWFSKLPGLIWNFLVNAYNKTVKWGKDTWNSMYNAASNAITAVIDWFKKLPGEVWTWLVNTIAKVTQFAKDLGNKAKEAGQNMVTNIIDAVKNLPKQMMDIGVNIVKGVWEGITSMGAWLGDKVSGFFGGIVDGAKSVLGIHSPSRIFRDQVGVFMAQGVGVGFEEEMDDVNADIQNSLMYDFDTPTNEQQTDNKIDKVINLLGKILEKDTTMDIDGREVMRALSPYQEEFAEYDSRNPSYA